MKRNDQSVQEINIIYNMVCNDAQFTNESFEPNSFEPVLFGEQIQPVHQLD